MDENNNSINVFQNELFGSIRILEEDGKYLFCGQDIAMALGYARPRDAIRRHTKGALKQRVLSNGGPQNMLFLPEGDVYRLIIHSQLPTAEAFERWVFDEIMPTLRKNGYYITKQLQMKLEAYETEIQALNEKLEISAGAFKSLLRTSGELELKANYYDALVKTETYTSIRSTAKELGVPEHKFILYLQMHNFLYRAADMTLLPYADAQKAGLFVVREFCRNGHSGCYTLFTTEGKKYFLERLGSIMKELKIQDFASY